MLLVKEIRRRALRRYSIKICPPRGIAQNSGLRSSVHLPVADGVTAIVLSGFMCIKANND